MTYEPMFSILIAVHGDIVISIQKRVKDSNYHFYLCSYLHYTKNFDKQ